jgi:preprotein translocase subunit SecF
MKSPNTIVTIVVIAAVLLTAYGVGLLIHQARVGHAPLGADANDAQARQDTPRLSHAREAAQPQDTPEMRALLKEKRAEALKKMETATEEQKAKTRKLVQDSFSPQAGQQPSAKLPQVSSTSSSVQDPNGEKSDEKTGSDPNAAGPR